MKSLRDLAIVLCELEGKKKQVDIAQMSEILRCLREIIKNDTVSVLKLLLK